MRLKIDVIKFPLKWLDRLDKVNSFINVLKDSQQGNQHIIFKEILKCLSFFESSCNR